jgi:hypothetical protein
VRGLSGKSKLLIGLILVIISLSLSGLYFMNYSKIIVGKAETIIPNELYRDLIDQYTASSISIYFTEKASTVLDIEAIEQIGLKPFAIKSLLNLPIVEKPTLLITHIDDFIESKPIDMLDRLLGSLRGESRVAIMILNPEHSVEKMRDVLEILLKYYGSRGEYVILPVDPEYMYIDKKQVPPIDQRVFKADALVFSINPKGVIIIDSLYDDSSFVLLTVMKWSELINPDSLNDKAKKVIGTSSIIEQKGVNSLGYIGYLTKNWTGRVCGEITGIMGVKLDLFYTNVTATTGTVYHAFFVHVDHEAKGYRTYCRGSYIDHYPKTFNTTIDWKTTTWPGQVLDNRDPKGYGTQQTISFTTGWNFGATLGTGASLSVVYSSSTTITQPNAPYYQYADYSDPWYGVASVVHNVEKPSSLPDSQLNYVTFTVEPTSVGFLDPNKAGGYPPMVIYGYFTAVNNHGDSASITVGIYMYPNSYSYWWS